MSKSIKFKNNIYWDSTGIIHNKELLSNLLNSSVVECGETSNGNYTKYAGGRLITVHQVDAVVKRTQEWGPLYESTEPVDLGNFPISFAYTPFVFVTLYGNDGILGGVKNATKSHAGKIYVSGPTFNASQYHTFQVLAVGRWK